MSRTGKWFIIAVIIALIVLLIRMKAILPASIMSFILFTAALTERVMRIRAIHRMGQASSPENSSMTIDEAKEILELDDPFTEDEVIQAHRRLIKKCHPDQGGSKYLAAKINRAKEILLEEVKK